MELGEKIRSARLEAGLSQRQLCGEEITRNMLSLIENGSAKPSMKTLRYLAGRLDKSLSWFLEEDAEENTSRLENVTLLEKARRALDQGRDLYAGELLEKVTDPAPEIQRGKLLLAARIPGADLQEVCSQLPSLDPELMVRARAALEAGDFIRCGHLLMAMEDQESPAWQLQLGTLLFLQREYSRAIQPLELALNNFPEEAAEKLEICFRELKDFEKAYFYACMRR